MEINTIFCILHILSSGKKIVFLIKILPRECICDFISDGFSVCGWFQCKMKEWVKWSMCVVHMIRIQSRKLVVMVWGMTLAYGECQLQYVKIQFKYKNQIIAAKTTTSQVRSPGNKEAAPHFLDWPSTPFRNYVSSIFLVSSIYCNRSFSYFRGELIFR